ncbi:NMCC_0638 family (lipo)protein [Janthinobacterium violaceinigrum]|uniref:NMCC_0638 family (lipo)protein n=1 Tax=Janthinobacterium violaceinigrum TaxID=2654252 RepID=UPI003860144E
MQLFLGVCVPSQGDVQQIETAVRRVKLVEVTSKEARALPDDVPGKSWSTSETGGRFTVVATQPQTCAVVVKQIAPADLKREFERWLPPASTGYTVCRKPRTGRAIWRPRLTPFCARGGSSTVGCCACP